jgi:transcriptional regulator with XRE-family HTH domain
MKTLTMEIKLARLRLGMSQPDLAEILGISKRRFIQIENNKMQLDNMPVKRFVKLCEVLDEEFRNNVMNREYLLTTFSEKG